MYEIFKNALKGQYELVDMLNKIGDKITYNGKRYECHLMYAYGIQMNTQRDGKRL